MGEAASKAETVCGFLLEIGTMRAHDKHFHTAAAIAAACKTVYSVNHNTCRTTLGCTRELKPVFPSWSVWILCRLCLWERLNRREPFGRAASPKTFSLVPKLTSLSPLLVKSETPFTLLSSRLMLAWVAR